MKKIRVTETELIQLEKKIIKEDAQNAYFTQKVTGQEMPHDADDMAPDGMDDDSDVNETEDKTTFNSVGSGFVDKQGESDRLKKFKENQKNVDEQETGVMGLDDAGSALDTMSYTNPDASGFQSDGPEDSYGGWDDEMYV